MTRNFKRLLFLAICCTAVFPLVAAGNAVPLTDSSNLAARTDAFVEKARRVYPSDPNCNLSVVKEFALANGTNVHLSGSAGHSVKWMSVPGVSNLRDIGGWNGLATGKVYRGSCNTAKGVDSFSNILGFKTEIDLREKNEIKDFEARLAPKYVNIPLKSYTNMFNRAFAASYADVLRMFKDESNYPIYVHCVGGADRTASIIFLLDGLCGVSRTDAEIDYELTSLCGVFGVRTRTDDSYKPFRPTMLEMMSRPGATWNEKVENFVRAELGLLDEEIESIRRNMMEKGVPTRVVRDVAYDSSIGRFGIGDLYLPEKMTLGTPVVLTIHGGGWGGGDRYSWSGVADFFCRDLGCVAFNIEYRLASVANRWPACGDDCVKAANWLFSDAFRELAGFTPKKIYICGGSAGGHLTLWTLVNLPSEKVAGCISISSIGDPAIDCVPHRGRYTALLGTENAEGDLSEMNPIAKIRSGMAPVLCTHVTEDKVVPIASHKAFADAYRAAGNDCSFFEYHTSLRQGLTGHCIWIPGSNPHRLIPELEARIKVFVERCERSSRLKVETLWRDFANPQDLAKPWCYWWWVNGHADRETITADLEAMKRLGFGGVLMFDSRGYWDDEEHVVNPEAEIVWGSPEWYDLVEFSIRECARIGLEFTMNASASGGWLNGFVDGKEYQVDVLNREEIVAHLDRTIGTIIKRVPQLVGVTFTHIYSPSYEGTLRIGASWSDIKDAFYATMSEWAHSRGLKLYSESGGPWCKTMIEGTSRGDQLDFLSFNDFPQGEFWLFEGGRSSPYAGHANSSALGRFFLRAPVLAARRFGKRIVSAEAFTHMLRHWSVDPAVLKPIADIAFADGANRLVWHTFTCSPKKFGIPGAEYFAGTHVNRNVTWHEDADGFVKYLGRCQSLLQRGEYVDDGEFVDVATNYYGWGRYRKNPKAQFTTIHRREGDTDWFFVAGEGKGDVVLNAANEGMSVEIWDAVTMTRKPAASAALPNGKTRVALDLPVGGSCFVVFIPKSFQTGLDEEGEKSSAVEPNSPVNPVNPVNPVKTIYPVTNAWSVSFAYHRGISAVPPSPVTMKTLRDWTSFGEDGNAASTELRYFAGTATYRTTQTIKQSGNHTIVLSLGEIPTGLAHVFVNDKDCGVVWCAPWEADVSGAVRDGVNEIEIRYTNNWHNRLVGDCFLPESERVTRSTVRYWTVPRRKSDPKRNWLQLPTVYSGPSAVDALQHSGILGSVLLKTTLTTQQKGVKE